MCERRAALGRVASLRFDLAVPGDDAELRRLLRENPMGGVISVSHEREPSFADALSIEGDRHQVAVARARDGKIVAMGVRSVADVFFNGRPARLGYLGQLRVEAAYRRRRGLFVDGYAFLGSQRGEDELPFDLTSIMADNTVARRFLAGGVRRLPRYQAWEPFVTLLVGLRGAGGHGRSRGIRIEPGSAQRLQALVDCLQRNGRRYQLAPQWTARDLLCPRRSRGLNLCDFHLAIQGGRVIGCLARWDQRRFKQSVIRGYAPGLGRWRSAINLAAPWAGMPRLPAVGDSLDSVFLSHMAVDGDDPNVLGCLIEVARRKARSQGASCLVMGLAARNPMLVSVRQMFRHRAYESVLYLVDWRSVGGAETTRDTQNPLSSLDGRVPHVEVAVL